jgi:arabinogalactan endo-1,4-beta-galactosidase
MDKFTKEWEKLNVTQRKEIVSRAELPQKTRRIEDKHGDDVQAQPKEETVSGILIKFLDAESFREKIEIFKNGRDELTERDLRNIAVCLDLTFEKNVDLYDYIMQHLELKEKYERQRLR